jgi:hypothetical protein
VPKKEEQETAYSTDDRRMPVFIGAGLYQPRMFPEGCPSFGKLQMKLFRLVSSDAGGR